MVHTRTSPLTACYYLTLSVSCLSTSDKKFVQQKGNILREKNGDAMHVLVCFENGRCITVADPKSHPK